MLGDGGFTPRCSTTIFKHTIDEQRQTLVAKARLPCLDSWVNPARLLSLGATA
jgi:hypothetical protein